MNVRGRLQAVESRWGRTRFLEVSIEDSPEAEGTDLRVDTLKLRCSCTANAPEGWKSEDWSEPGLKIKADSQNGMGPPPGLYLGTPE